MLVCVHFHQHALVQQQGTTTSTHHALPTHHTPHTNTPTKAMLYSPTTNTTTHYNNTLQQTALVLSFSVLTQSYLLIVKMKASDCKVWVVLELKDFFRVLQFQMVTQTGLTTPTAGTVQQTVLVLSCPVLTHLTRLHQSLLAQAVQQFGQARGIAGQRVVIVKPVGLNVLQGHFVIGEYSSTVDR